ncbi:MAG: CDP-diacylglycerol--glycerol-3-phosphate 3-phosphatidyltransferase [Alphaproteobacteria bacterium]|nr:CDP-diacylglycerol--glycerol-3-phosphate 3-phosphatidyltransferase [Alphaproteobacteria bacterium]
MIKLEHISPNYLTVIRIVIIPLVALFLLINTDLSRWIALSLYCFAGLTDFFDGYIARKTGQSSALGRFLDPIADKLLVATIIIVLIIMGDQMGGLSAFNAFAGIIIVLREITVSGLREYLAEIKISVPVSSLAKWKTVFQLFSLGFLIIGSEASPKYIPSGDIGVFLLWVSAIFTIVTGQNYLRSGIKHMLNDDRKE